MTHLVNSKISLSLAVFVITFLSCFLIIMRHGIIQLQDMLRWLWMVLRGKIKPLAMGAIISCRAVIKDAK